MSPSLPADMVQVHLRNNRNSAGHWDHFSEHRTRMTALLLESAPAPPGTLAILGAGNCNDVDLPAVAGRFRELHLVDVDQDALRRARERQPADVADSLTLRAPVDLSGALPRVAAFRNKPPTPAQLLALPGTAADGILAALPDRFDTVISACILSQIMHGCRLALGPAPFLGQLAHALVTGHLRALVQLARPGGTALFVTDVVSSESYPLEELWSDKAPAEHLEHVEQSDNVFSGVGATYVRRILSRDPVIAPLIETPRLVEPWLWKLGPKVTLLVYALVLKRRS